MAARIDIDSLSLRYPDAPVPALNGLSCAIPAGSCVGIVGPTGAGKTTLLHCLAGILGRHHPDLVISGSVRIGDTNFTGIPRDILFPRVGLVLQDPSVQISGVRDTVFEEVLFTLENMGGDGNVADTRIRAALQRLGIDHLGQRKPTSLSGGETQRVALATILVAHPEVLLLDEPTSALDSTAQARLRSILMDLKGKTTVLLSDAQIDFPLSVCDRILAIDHGTTIVYTETRHLLSTAHNLPMIGGWERWGHLARNLRSRAAEGSREAHRILNVLDLA